MDQFVVVVQYCVKLDVGVGIQVNFVDYCCVGCDLVVGMGFDVGIVQVVFYCDFFMVGVCVLLVNLV